MDQDPLVDALVTRKKMSGLTWVDLAREIGLDTETVVKMAKGGEPASVRIVQTLAAYFQWTPGDVGTVVLWDRTKTARRGRRR